MRTRAVPAIVVVFALTACGGSSGPSGNSVATVEVSPGSVTRQVGQTVQLAVALKNSSGALVSGHGVTWTSSNQPVATVTSGGLVTTGAIGTATITASAGGRSGTAQITVTGVPVATVTVTPDARTLDVGETLQLMVQLRDASGNILTEPTVTWSSSSPQAASVSQSGLVTAVSEGFANVTASAGGVSDQAAITVIGPCSIALTPDIHVGQPVDGELTPADCQIDDGSYLDGYRLIVEQNTSVQIDMTSTAFDTYLMLWELVNPTTLALRGENDDVSSASTDSRITFTLNGGAEYYVLANSLEAARFGAYQLSVTPISGDVAGRVTAPPAKSVKVLRQPLRPRVRR